MKYIYLFITLILVEIPSFGQGSSESQYRNNNLRTSGNTKQRLDSLITENKSKTVFEYDGNYKASKTSSYYWDVDHWTYSYYIQYETNVDGLLSQEISYNKDGVNWVAADKILYEYNVDKKVSEVTGYNWDENLQQWKNSWKNNYTYGTNGITQKLGYQWDVDSWKAFSKSDYEYDKADANDIRIENAYNWSNEQWKFQESIMILYDLAGNVSEETSDRWDDDNSEFKQNYYTLYTYDNAYSYDDLIMPAFMTLSRAFPHKIVQSESTGEKGLGKTIFYYTNLVATNIEDATISSLKIYPNPATNRLFIETEKKPSALSILDITGKEISTLTNAENSIDVNSLQNGVYFLKVNTESEVSTLRFVKEQ